VIRRLRRFLVLSCAMTAFSMVASADIYNVGILSYDQISASQTAFDITNLTGLAAFPPDEPITTKLTFTITNLVVNFSAGPFLVLPGSDFTVVDSFGDLNCTGSGCNLFGQSIVSAVLTGTLSPTSGISGLTGSDTGLEAAFTATLTPGCSTGTLAAGCDAVLITATGTSGTGAVPEPGSFFLLGTAMAGALFAGIRSRRQRQNAA
jgi:hypothetical protein